MVPRKFFHSRWSIIINHCSSIDLSVISYWLIFAHYQSLIIINHWLSIIDHASLNIDRRSSITDQSLIIDRLSSIDHWSLNIDRRSSIIDHRSSRYHSSWIDGRSSVIDYWTLNIDHRSDRCKVMQDSKRCRIQMLHKNMSKKQGSLYTFFLLPKKLVAYLKKVYKPPCLYTFFVTVTF